MRLFLDCEWNGYRGDLISMALVAENGREWYGVRFCDDPAWWIAQNVVPVLNAEPQRDSVLRASLAAFLREFDACQIVADWPEDVAHFCRFLVSAEGKRIGPDVLEFVILRNPPDGARMSAVPHNALADARALAAACLRA